MYYEMVVILNTFGTKIDLVGQDFPSLPFKTRDFAAKILFH